MSHTSNNLGTNLRNPKFFNNVSVPDTDSRGIELNVQGVNVIPNFLYDHPRVHIFLDQNISNNQKTVAAGANAVYFGTIIAGKMYLRESIESTA